MGRQRYELSLSRLESPAESLHQALASLQQLDAVIDHLFSSISNHVNFERQKLEAVQNRIVSAQSKVAQISQNANKVTTIYASATYPHIVAPIRPPLGDPLVVDSLSQPSQPVRSIDLKQRVSPIFLNIRQPLTLSLSTQSRCKPCTIPIPLVSLVVFSRNALSVGRILKLDSQRSPLLAKLQILAWADFQRSSHHLPLCFSSIQRRILSSHTSQ